MHDLSLGVAAAIKPFRTRVALAKVLGIHRFTAISQWKRVPVDRVLDIEHRSDGKVTRHEMRPDVYPEKAA